MKTNRLSETLTHALNDQMTKEAHASQIYLSYAAWADNLGYGGVANFLFRSDFRQGNLRWRTLYRYADSEKRYDADRFQ